MWALSARGWAHLALWTTLVGLCWCDGSTKNEASVVVVGAGECADCMQLNIRTSDAFSGLLVAIDCRARNGETFKTRGSGKLDSDGKFHIKLPNNLVNKDGQLTEECFAQLHSASQGPCPATNGLEPLKIVLKLKENGEHTFGTAGKLSFTPSICTSALLWSQYMFPPLSKPKLKFPFKKPHPPSFPIYKPKPKLKPIKPFPPIVPGFKKPLPPPIPLYKKPLPHFPKLPPIPPILPIYKKPLPPIPKIPEIYKKPLPPFPKIPPMYKKPMPPFPKIPPVYKKPLPPIPKIPPIYKKPLPPIPKFHPILKKPLPPIPKFHPILKKPLPPIPKFHPILKKPLPPIPKFPPTFKKPLPPFPLPPHFP